MHRSILIKIAICSVAFLFCLYGGSFKVDAANANLQSLRILDTIPQSDAGISTSTIVPDDTCFGVLIESTYPIDTVDPGSIRFEIDDGIHYVYERDLSSATIRVLEVTGDDPGQNLIWVVYDRSLEIQLLPLYYPDRIVHITVSAADIHENTLSPRQFRFKIASDPGHLVDFNGLPDYDFVDSNDLIYERQYDSGMEILSGELAGAKIIFDSDEPLTPGFGPSEDVEPLYLDDEDGIGEPLNLVPHTVFHKPVKLFIPFPEGTDLADTDIFYHNGVEWLRACDTDGNVLPGGIGWMVAGSRVDHYEASPPLVEIQVYHFSSVQGFVAFRSNNTTTGSSGSGTHSGSGGFAAFKCFIDAAANDFQRQQIYGLFLLLLVLLALGAFPLVKAYRHNKWNGFLS